MIGVLQTQLFLDSISQSWPGIQQYLMLWKEKQISDSTHSRLSPVLSKPVSQQHLDSPRGEAEPRTTILIMFYPSYNSSQILSSPLNFMILSLYTPLSK